MGDANKAALVQVRDLGKVYEPSPRWMRLLLRSAIDTPVVALDGLSFDVQPGEVFAVVGPNGAGKSTLFRILTGLTTPSDGSATVAGCDATRQSRQVRRLVGFVPADDRSLFLRHTAFENLYFHGNLQGLSRRTLRQRVHETLELVGLGHAATRVGFALSSGMRARLQLARALIHQPAVLILDEPTGSVDPVGSYELLQLVERLTRERRLATLLSSHRLEEIEALHDHVLLLDRGRLVHRGDLDALRQLWDAPRTHISFDHPAAAVATAEALALAPTGLEVELSGRDVVVTGVVSVGALLGLLDGQTPHIDRIETRRPSLLEVLGRLAQESRPTPVVATEAPR